LKNLYPLFDITIDYLRFTIYEISRQTRKWKIVNREISDSSPRQLQYFEAAAERQGFEPWVEVSPHNCLAGSCLKPCSATSPHLASEAARLAPISLALLLNKTASFNLMVLP
jgi:hypothetical protein